MQSFDPVDLLGPRQVEHRLGLKDAKDADTLEFYHENTGSMGVTEKEDATIQLLSSECVDFGVQHFWTKRCFPLTQLLTSPLHHPGLRIRHSKSPADAH